MMVSVRGREGGHDDGDPSRLDGDEDEDEDDDDGDSVFD